MPTPYRHHALVVYTPLVGAVQQRSRRMRGCEGPMVPVVTRSRCHGRHAHDLDTCQRDAFRVTGGNVGGPALEYDGSGFHRVEEVKNQTFRSYPLPPTPVAGYASPDGRPVEPCPKQYRLPALKAAVTASGCPPGLTAAVTAAWGLGPAERSQTTDCERRPRSRTSPLSYHHSVKISDYLPVLGFWYEPYSDRWSQY